MKVLNKLVLALAIGGAMMATAHGAGGPGTRQVPGQQAAVVDQAKRLGAWSVARLLADPQATSVLARRVSLDGKPVMLDTIVSDLTRRAGAANAAGGSVAGMSASVRADAEQLRVVDQRLREHKGIGADSRSLMQLRLYTPAGYSGHVDWDKLLVAYAPAGKRREWMEVEAFDKLGRSHRLDARVAPAYPVLIAGINGREDMRAGIAYLNRRLRAAGMQSAPAIAGHSLAGGVQAMAGGIETSKLTHVSLKNDQEPWVSGGAEIFAVVSGVQPDQAKAELTVVDMPYLDNDGTTYAPNQIMIFWSSYRYGAANIQLFEHDDSTNYQELAVALSQGVTTLLGAFAPQYAVIGQVATAILKVMPAGWFSNDDDYVDSFYTLEKGRTYTNYGGAAGNAVISLSPYTLQ
ncbi:DUF3103 family protein [Massilia sp. Dwa41.01b]|uniref:DUF3103 family protein n=1 Tax=unclassified Massilia TaxID=2609279 RepID=UPI001602A9E9|nr:MULTISPECIES: DUF3103 family protein [unclassified Massilia]QNA89025.1 DUF3103 family protein [Massilia sp. Dwa41.01b]QNA99912.1 DUF3103 family protein [Massilia sp. Se16.2.3]